MLANNKISRACFNVKQFKIMMMLAAFLSFSSLACDEKVAFKK